MLARMKMNSVLSSGSRKARVNLQPFLRACASFLFHTTVLFQPEWFYEAIRAATYSLVSDEATPLICLMSG
jgi:hypothetical protein